MDLTQNRALRADVRLGKCISENSAPAIKILVIRFLARMRRRFHFSQRRIQVGMLIENVSTFYADFRTKISSSSLVFMDYGLRRTDKGMLSFNFLL